MARTRVQPNNAGDVTVEGKSLVTVETDGVERVRVTDTGRVGIGTSSPGADLHTYKASGTVRNRVTSGAGNIDLAHNGSAGYLINGTGALSIWANNTERMLINNAGLITGSGTSLGAWTAYTPTLGGTGWAIGNATLVAYYVQVGKIVHVRIRIIFGTTSTYGSVSPTLTLPVTGVSAGSNLGHWQADFTDASAGTTYVMAPVQLGTTTVAVDNISSVNVRSAFTSAAPVTVTTSDTLLLRGTYEIA
jgi:hypothetical protein